jgi:hypothetical protein
MNKLYKEYVVSSVSREDLEGIGFDVSKVDDETMRKLASKLSDAYMENGFWIDLPIIAEYLEISKKNNK